MSLNQFFRKLDGADGSSPVGIPVGKAHDIRILVEKDDWLKYKKESYSTY